MRSLLVVLLAAGLVCAAQAETKKKTPPKPAAAAPAKKPAKEKGDLLFGALSKSEAEGKSIYTLQIGPSEKVEIPSAMAKKMYIDLDKYVGKRVALSCFQDDSTKAIKSLLWMKTEAEYKKQDGGK